MIGIRYPEEIIRSDMSIRRLLSQVLGKEKSRVSYKE